jgi:ribosomal protein S27AE
VPKSILNCGKLGYISSGEGAKTTSQRMAEHDERQSPEEKRFNNGYYALKEQEIKRSNKTAEEALQNLENKD